MFISLFGYLVDHSHTFRIYKIKKVLKPWGLYDSYKKIEKLSSLVQVGGICDFDGTNANVTIMKITCRTVTRKYLRFTRKAHQFQSKTMLVFDNSNMMTLFTT